MRKLLTVYKGCRYLDRLLNTNFFHEDNFMASTYIPTAAFKKRYERFIEHLCL